MLESIAYISCGRFVSQGKWIHPDRVIDSHEMIFVLCGEVAINEEGVEYVLGENDVLHLEPGRRHFGFRESENTSFHWLHWRRSASYPAEPMPKLLHPENPYRLSLLFHQLLDYSADSRYAECPDYVTRLILAEVYAESLSGTETRRANRVAEWIRGNSARPIRATDAAAQFGYNVDYLSRLFRKQFGKSLKEYIDGSRMQYIKNQLLNSAAPMKEIAEACGFEEYKYFLKFFKYHEKITPTEFCNCYARTHINHH